ncbi:DUF2971 domain-containing protein [Aquimarina rubra]|uniref:DUF2971 domain-containing protein n=1 Tax=Aquimarina rubra TaxID=1920033 RepID=A0ABW5LGK3_9FLAO
MKILLNEIIPDSLFKYRNFQSDLHRRIITHQEIYFAKPSEFLAAYDCEYTIDRDYLKNEDNRREYYSKYYDISDPNHPYVDSLIESNPITDELIDGIELATRKKIDDISGIFSGSLTNRNANLWKVFGGNHKGFCVELNLLDTFPLNFGSKGYVKYVKDADLPKSKVLNHDNIPEYFSFITDLIFNLPLRYSEEQEYRIEKLFFEDSQRAKKIRKEQIKSITLGYKMSKTQQEEIIELIREHLPHVTIRRLKYDRPNLKEVIIN